MNRTNRRPLPAALLVVAVVMGTAGCRGGQERVDVSGAAAPDASTSSSTELAPSTTQSVATTTTPSTRVATTVRAATTSTRKATPPRVVVAQQGDRVVAVFVATGSELDSPSFTRAKARLATLGYKDYSGGDTGCSRGAKEALPQLKEYSLSLEFATRADADRFSALYGPVIGTAAVNVFCAD